MYIVLFLTISVNFKKMHNFGSDRIDALEKASYAVTYCGDTATAFAVSAFGRQFGVTVAHFNCNTSCPSVLEHCPGLDISLILECPPRPTAHALDASKFTEPLTGDDAFVFGFGLDSNYRSYRASMGDRFKDDQYQNNTAYMRMPIVKSKYRFLTGAAQSKGFSGSCVLNGYGIIGVACANLALSTIAIIVPWADVHLCIEQKVRAGVKLPNECNLTTIPPPTLLNIVERNLLPYFKSNSYIHSMSVWIYNNF
jgi:hypothetical protein